MCIIFVFFFFKQKTAYEMRISDWSSDVCSSDLRGACRARASRILRPCATLRAAMSIEVLAPIQRRPLHNELADRLRHMIVEGEQIGRASCRERVCQYV